MIYAATQPTDTSHLGDIIGDGAVSNVEDHNQ